MELPEACPFSNDSRFCLDAQFLQSWAAGSNICGVPGGEARKRYISHIEKDIGSHSEVSSIFFSSKQPRFRDLISAAAARSRSRKPRETSEVQMNEFRHAGHSLPKLATTEQLRLNPFPLFITPPFNQTNEEVHTPRNYNLVPSSF